MPEKKQNENADRLRNDHDVHDEKRDEERLYPDETTMNLPEVHDIPGQEHVRPPALGELADTTASSDDEEGKGLLDDLNDDASRGNNQDKENTEGIP